MSIPVEIPKIDERLAPPLVAPAVAVRPAAMRIAYLIPEFPGQTHILFWREMRELAALGPQIDLVSTRGPDPSVVCHEWSREAMRRTVYLFPPRAAEFLRGIGMILRAGPRAWVALAGVLLGRGVGGPAARLRLAGLAVIGGILASLARRRGWKHLHVHTCGDAAYVAAMANIIGGLPYSLTLHGLLAWFGGGQRFKWGRAKFVIAVTERLKEEAVAAIGPDIASRVDVAPMGVDAERFTRRAPLARRDPAESWRIVTCGRLHEGKGHQDLIRAVAVLRASGVPATLTIVGGGEARGMLEGVVKELRLEAAVRMAGALDEDGVRAELEAADVFALGSHEEAIGVATMEAMAMGLPVVVTRVGGVPELVRDGVDGYLVTARDPVDIAAGLRRVYDDPDRAAAMGEAGAERVRASFSSRVSAERIARRLGVIG